MSHKWPKQAYFGSTFMSLLLRETRASTASRQCLYKNEILYKKNKCREKNSKYLQYNTRHMRQAQTTTTCMDALTHGYHAVPEMKKEAHVLRHHLLISSLPQQHILTLLRFLQFLTSDTLPRNGLELFYAHMPRFLQLLTYDTL